ncbi:MAG: indole-3-glycerol phosphate synthase TrpC [Phycisphaerae bacterium]|nr:indole-3-glycerol phosphate synthase TrpC [Phycisphaerae bacterium]
MSTILDQIVETKRAEVAAAKADRPIEDLRAACAELPRPRNFYAAMAAEPPRGVHLIAEIKKASPSAGLIRPDFDPVAIARTYYAAGASALSVLTDKTYFQGDLRFIEQVRDAVPLPVLRKDFIIDEYQVYEARAAGADAILLISEVLTPQEVMDLLIRAAELHLTTLVEVHDADTLLQLRSVIGFPHRRYNLLGINNRDLRVQRTDINTFVRLAELAEAGTLLVAESGIKTNADVRRLVDAGANALLIGETFMRADDIGAKVRELIP